MAGSIAGKSVLGELAKRVPNNQKKQFRKFVELNREYKKRVDKYPEKLPRIDWDYYRTNVRIDAIKMVDEFEKKYEELNKVFDDRVKLDTKKYYNELEQQRTVVQAQIKQYIVESNERVKAYEAEILRLCNMKPYSSMTMEEFINLRPECSNYIPHQRKPLFWPHDPDEQTPGPVGLMTRGGSGGGEGGGGDAGGEGGKHSIKPGDIKSDTANFEFKEVEVKSMKDKQENMPEKSPQAEIRQEVTSNSVEEPKLHVDKPASKEEKQKLDPCGLIEKQDMNEKAEAATEEKSRKIETPIEPGKKHHPCDLVKGMRESATKGEVTCEAAAKGPYKDEVRRTCVFVDPCNVGFGERVTAKIEKPISKTEPKPQPVEAKKTQQPELVKEKPENDKDPCKSAAKKEQSKSLEPKKSQPCDMVKKKPEPNQEICKSAAPKGHYKDAKGNCVFVDPCNVGFGAGVAKVEPAVEKMVPKTESKPQLVEPKKIHPCEMAKKKPDPAKNSCKIGANEEQSKPIEAKKAQPCELVKKRTDTIKDSCKTTAKKEEAPSIEPKKTQPSEVVKKSTDSYADICKGATAKVRSKDEKGACVFADPCSVGFGAGIKVDPNKPPVEKVATKAAPKQQSRKPESKHPYEVIKKKPDAVIDPCKSVAKKEQSQPKEAKKTNLCEDAKKKADTKEDPCKVSAKKEESQPKKAKKTNLCEDAKKKADTKEDPCKISAKKEQSKDVNSFVDPCDVGSVATKSTQSKSADSKATTIVNPCNWQPVRPKTMNKSQTGDDVIKDKDSCTMVFADPKNTKSDCAKEDEKKHSKSCGALPHYNPFRSEAENQKNEEKMCEESEDDDPCANHNIEEDYYNPCKDDKDDECE